MKISGKFCHFKESSAFQREGTQLLIGQWVFLFSLSVEFCFWHNSKRACYRLLLLSECKLLFNPCKHTNPHLCTIKGLNLNTMCWDSDAGGRGINTGRRNKEEHRWKSSSTWKIDNDCGVSALALWVSSAWGNFESLLLPFVSLIWQNSLHGMEKNVFTYKYLINSILKSHTLPCRHQGGKAREQDCGFSKELTPPM